MKQRKVLHVAGLIVLVVASAALGGRTRAASAGALVDPSTLTPPPPNATCRAAGNQVICDTFVVEDLVNEPVFDLPCGTVYETSHYRGDGTRWYVNGLVVRRHVAMSLDGSWSLSPEGTGPTVKISGGWSGKTIWTTPGDTDTAVETQSGSDFKASAPGAGDHPRRRARAPRRNPSRPRRRLRQSCDGSGTVRRARRMRRRLRTNGASFRRSDHRPRSTRSRLPSHLTPRASTG